MSQRSYGNDRYRKDAKIGSTRKSAAKAKPIRKQGTVESSGSSSSPKTKAKTKDSGIEKDWSGLPTSPEIKKWRRVWWALLLTGLGMIGITYLIPDFRTNEELLKVVSAVVLGFSVAAIMVDLIVIRKLRKDLIAGAPAKKSSKQASAASPKDAKGTAEGSKQDAKDSGDKGSS